MEFEQNNGKVIITNIPNSSLSKQQLITTDLEIRRIRKYLLLIYGIGLVLCIYGLIYSIFSNKIMYCSITNGRLEEIGEFIVAILFFALGLYSASRYSETGLRVMAWLGIIDLIGSVVAIFILVIFSLMNSKSKSSIGISLIDDLENSHAKRTKQINPLVIIVIYTFKLTKLISAKKTQAIQQIERVVYSTA
ncbi:unnamed protein product [Rotaria sordida]|uniref:Uncharacterized protein n=2 Tax=Rotaria sordida TaxID=392033 RepID=A0A815HX11_9BILA|nr:unnamed protein product [Rotaria sordida]CAF1269322.1 unnamed protein product [Rotaria sordida]CAF1358274.1 unnamed protein product [Rotaria sordida]CAF4003736.1 unnamed protein product [Rotaria sordida]CAF4104378.1 unnamed protein product [Rotaria sordida]